MFSHIRESIPYLGRDFDRGVRGTGEGGGGHRRDIASVRLPEEGPRCRTGRWDDPERRNTLASHDREPRTLGHRSGLGGRPGQPIWEGLYNVSYTDKADAPIYDRLVQERGDVPAEVRQTAERTLREVERAMDFRVPRPLAR